MDKPRRKGLIDELSRLSPVDKIYDKLEREKIVENLVGFIPCGDATDTKNHIVNLGATLAMEGLNVCVFDGDAFYPSIYKLIDNELLKEGKGILKVLKDEKADIRENIQPTGVDNLFLMSASPLDAMEEYFEIEERSVERLIGHVKEAFDIVLIYIPNIPPLEFCYEVIKMLHIGFLMWSPRVECPINTHRLFVFLNSIGISTAKIANVLYCNTNSIGFDMSIIKGMGLKLITEFPEVSENIELSLEGKIYVKDAMLMDKRYKGALKDLTNILGR